jgi:hypothetical protein
VNGQQRHRFPRGQRLGHEHESPANGDPYEQQHADLNEAPDIEAICQSARQPAQKEIRHPMRDHCKGAQGRRVKFLKHHKVADDVLDVVGHHRCGGGKEEHSEVGIAERSEGAVPGRGKRRGGGGIQCR